MVLVGKPVFALFMFHLGYAVCMFVSVVIAYNTILLLSFYFLNRSFGHSGKAYRSVCASEGSRRARPGPGGPGARTLRLCSSWPHWDWHGLPRDWPYYGSTNGGQGELADTFCTFWPKLCHLRNNFPLKCSFVYINSPSLIPHQQYSQWFAVFFPKQVF